MKIILQVANARSCNISDNNIATKCHVNEHGQKFTNFAITEFLYKQNVGQELLSMATQTSMQCTCLPIQLHNIACVYCKHVAATSARRLMHLQRKHKWITFYSYETR